MPNDLVLLCSSCGVNKPSSEFGKSKTRSYKKRQGHNYYCRLCGNAADNRRNRILREQVFDKLGRCCVKCGFDNPLALQIDHVNGKGREERQALKSVVKFLHKVLNDESGLYQILCANCNWIKRLTSETL